MRELLHPYSPQQVTGHLLALASMGLAKIDDAEAATMARTSADMKRIVFECDMGSDNSGEDGRLL